MSVIGIDIVSGQLYRDTYRIVAYPYRPSPSNNLEITVFVFVILIDIFLSLFAC